MLLLTVFLAFANPIQVGIEEGPPYAYQEDGVWEGTSVYYWEEAAQRANIDYEYVEVEFKDVIPMLQSGELDVYVPAMTATATREEQVDFSFPYSEDSLGLAQKHMTSVFNSNDLIVVLCVMAIALNIIAAIYSFLEPNTSFIDSVYWAVTTASTTGYGDQTPKTDNGKLLAMFWMLCGCILFSYMSGSIIVSMTEEKTISQDIDVPVTVISGTTAEKFAEQKHIAYTTVSTEAHLQAAYRKGDYVIHDISLLGNVNYKRIENTKQPYAFAFPQGSPLRESVNVALLQVLDNPPPGVN